MYNLKFSNVSGKFLCPICNKSMTISSNYKSLLCMNNHCYDLAKQGYVNFLSQKGNYTENLFRYRKIIFEKGFYKPVVDRIKDIIDSYFIDKNITILDVGCGEGYYSDSIQKEYNNTIFSFDISKDAINIASKRNKNVIWMISDLNNIPIKNNSVDCILDILTPANYKEFCRVLKKKGYLIKVIPGNNYLFQLRKLASNELKNKEYNNKKVIDYYNDHMKLIRKETLTYTLKLDKEEAIAFANMTPMTMDVNLQNIDLDKLTEITIDLEILVGKIN